jgi:DNA-binding FadR family transcriptional regulator
VADGIDIDGEDEFLVPAGQGNSLVALVRLRRFMDAAIVRGETMLPPERRLADTLGVGRGALRRALDVVEAEGLVRRIQGSGTYLGNGPPQPPDIEEMSQRASPGEVMEVRVELEPVVARLAADRASPAEIETMRRLARRVASAIDRDAYELWDAALHRAIAEAARNRLFLDLLEIIEAVRQDENFRSLRERARDAEAFAEAVTMHDRIVEAIAARDGVAAAVAMREHLVLLSGRMRAAGDPPEPVARPRQKEGSA